MMRFKDLIRLLVISLVLTAWACDPVEVPEPKDEDPPFWSEIELDDTDHNWTSGKSNVYNFSNYEAVRGDGIRYSSILRPDSCDSPCPSSFQIDLFGPDRWMAGQMVNPAVQFRPAVRDWFRENEKVAGYTLNGNLMEINQPMQALDSVVWKLNGEVVARDKSDVNIPIFEPNRAYNLCVDIKGENGIEKQICHSSKKVDAKPLIVKLNGRINPTRPMIVELMGIVEGGELPYTYYWNGNEDSLHTKSIESISDIMEVNFRVEDSQGTSVTIINKVHFVNNKRPFPINARLRVNTKREDMHAPVFNKASIRWVDREGSEYSTAFGEQPNWASFRVESFEPFRSSATEDPMAKVGLAFKGVMYSKDGHEREIRSGRATMLFRYPN